MQKSANQPLSISGQYHLRTLLKNGDQRAITEQLLSKNELIIATYLEDINLDLDTPTWEFLQKSQPFLTAIRQDDKLKKNVQKNIILQLLLTQEPTADYNRFAFLITNAFFDGDDTQLPSSVFAFINHVISTPHINTMRYLEPQSLVNFLLHCAKTNQFRIPTATFNLMAGAHLLQRLPTDQYGFSKLFQNKKLIRITIPSSYKSKTVEKSALFLDDALTCLDFIIKQDGSTSYADLLLMTDHAEVALKMLDHDMFTRFIGEHLDEIAAKHFVFAAKALKLLKSGGLASVPQRHEARALANTNLNNFMSTIYGQQNLSLWSKSRLYLEAQQGNNQCLTEFIEHIDEDQRESVLVNQLCAASYANGNAAAGIKFADNLFNGNGIAPNENEAIKLYEEIAENHPEYITPSALTRFAEPLLYIVQTRWAEFHQLCRLMGNAPSQTESAQDKAARYNIKLKSHFGANNARIFQYVQLINQPEIKSPEAKEVEEKANEALESLSTITELKLDDNPELKNHFSLITAHAINVSVLVEQRDNYQGDDAEWLQDVERSLKIAWSYVNHPLADPEIKAFIEKIIQWPGELKNIIERIEAEVDQEQNATKNGVISI